MANTKQMNIQREARVEATDGEVGRVKHVVVDPQTKEVTDIVVGQGGDEWLIPLLVLMVLARLAFWLLGKRRRDRDDFIMEQDAEPFAAVVGGTRDPPPRPYGKGTMRRLAPETHSDGHE